MFSQRRHKRALKIYSLWQMFETANPDIPTNQLIAMTAEFARCGYDEVVAAIELVDMKNSPTDSRGMLRVARSYEKIARHAEGGIAPHEKHEGSKP